MSSEDQDKKFAELLHGSLLEKEFPVMNSPFFAQKVIGEIKKGRNSPSVVFYFLQSKYAYWVLFLALVLFPALTEANSLRSLCFS